jgi:glutamate/aspartate transport system substrate-binding protein
MGYPLKRCVPAASLAAALVLLTTAASAQTAGGEGLSPTLDSIKKAHVVRLGYRESSPPFSFLDQANRPIGYSLELCEAIVDEIGVEVDDANLKIEYVRSHPTTAFRRWCRTRSTSNADRPPPMRSAADRWRFRR